MLASACYGHDSLCFNEAFNPYVTYPVLIGGHLGYLAVIYTLQLIMKNRAPLQLKNIMLVYNALQVVLSVTMAVSLAPFLKNSVFNLNGKFNGTIEYWIFVHYVTKFLDMFDTVFMVLRKKSDQISFLHVYHHLTIGLIWGLLLHNGIANGTAFFGAWINSSVHALMYFHYLYTSLGYSNPLKKYLTQVQMFQFALCILHAVLAVLVDREIPRSWAILQLCYHMTLLYLFLQFYRNVVVGKKSRAATKAKI